MQKSPGKVKTHTRVRGKAWKVDDEAVLHTCIPSIFPCTKSATPRNPPPPPPPRGKTSTASRGLAPVRGPCKVVFRIPYSLFKPRHTSVLPVEAMAYFCTGFFTTSYFPTVFLVLGILSFCKLDPRRFLVPVLVSRAYFHTLSEGHVVQPYGRP